MKIFEKKFTGVNEMFCSLFIVGCIVFKNSKAELDPCTHVGFAYNACTSEHCEINMTLLARLRKYTNTAVIVESQQKATNIRIASLFLNDQHLNKKFNVSAEFLV